MKTLAIECKTFYTVELSFSEWWEIFKKSEDETIEDARKRYKDFPILCNGDDMRKLAKALGFDGWQNAGYINNRNNAYTCVLYNRGDNL